MAESRKKPTPPQSKALRGPPENKALAEAVDPAVPAVPEPTPEPKPAAPVNQKPRTVGFLKIKE